MCRSPTRCSRRRWSTTADHVSGRPLRSQYRRRLVHGGARDVRPDAAASTTSATRSPTSGRRCSSSCGPSRAKRDFHGRYFDMPAGFMEPKPLQKPYPVIMNAGTSPAGRAFAAKHSDLIFAGLTNSRDGAASRSPRSSGSRGSASGARSASSAAATSSAATREQEAAGYYDHVHRAGRRLRRRRERHRDQQAPLAEHRLDGSTSASCSRAWSRASGASRWSARLTRSPQQMLDLHAAGADGIAISFVDYDEGLEQTGDADACPAWSRPAPAGRCRCPLSGAPRQRVSRSSR